MAQNRDAPAYQEYAASVMAKTQYRVLSLSERGLLYTLKLECWVNREMPSDPATLARVLGFDAADVAAALPQVLPFFAIEGPALTCPELDDYRAHIDGRREKLSEAGKKGAAKTNNKHQGTEAATPTATPRPGRGPLVKPSQAKPSQVQSSSIPVLTEKPSDTAWLNEYEQHSRGF